MDKIETKLPIAIEEENANSQQHDRAFKATMSDVRVEEIF